MIGTEIICCNTELECYEFTNECPHCETEYNWTGARLRKNWDFELQDD
jgi:hypothetical protein